jgi:hypothetical protein
MNGLAQRSINFALQNVSTVTNCADVKAARRLRRTRRTPALIRARGPAGVTMKPSRSLPRGQRALEVAEIDLRRATVARGGGADGRRRSAADLHQVKGEFQRPTPMVLGHEGAGSSRRSAQA